MNFGVGVGDLLTLSVLAWNVYKLCRDSSPQYQGIKGDVASMHAVIKETEELEGLKLKPEQQERLAMLKKNYQDVLLDLKKMVDGYESLGTQQQRTWDRMKWGLEPVTEIKQRLVSTTTALGAFSSMLVNSTSARIEIKLDKFLAEIRHGLREGSVVSESTVESVETKETWQNLRRELEDIGLSKTAISENQAFITAWFKEALAAGLMDEGAPDVRPITLGQISSRDSALGSSDLDDFSTIADDLGSSPSLKDEPSPFQPLGHASNMSTSTSLINSSSPLPFTLFNNPFYESARARYGDDPNDPSPFDPSRELPPITPYTTTTSSTSSGGTPRRKSSKFSSLMFKLFHSPLLLIEAASDGDAAKVSKLLALGADVNAVDKWKWTAMSMAAYGGHAEVAKILIAAGARLDMKDVDGETPLDLATKGGHRELVMLIDEEETRRGLVGVSEA